MVSIAFSISTVMRLASRNLGIPANRAQLFHQAGQSHLEAFIVAMKMHLKTIGSAMFQCRRSARFPLTLLLCAVHGEAIFAQGDPVEVSDVEFRYENLAGATDDWVEIAIEIEGGGNAAADGENHRFSSDIRVALGLGYQLSRSSVGRFRFFQAEAVVVTLEQGNKRTVYFYLPPEVVKRDRLPKEPFAYLVELSVGGETLATRRGNVSSNLGDASRVANFKTRMAAAANETRGVLLPIFETPFYIARDKLRSSPAYRRVPAAR